MIKVRRDQERHHDRRRRQEVWLTFDSRDRADPLADGFGSLQRLDEDRLAPNAGAPRHAHRDAEIVTYVREGTLAHEDSFGRAGVIHAGEFQRMTAGSGIRHSEANASRTDWAHVFQVCFRTSEAGLEPSQEQRRFCAAERRGVLCVVASPDGRKGSLRIHQNALMYSAMLRPGQHIVHELARGRSAWVHVVHGEAALGDVVLHTGDGAAVTEQHAASLTARGDTELLLLDVGDAPQSAIRRTTRP